MTVALEPRTTLIFRLGALLVRGAGVLVPPRKRPDWRREWEAELWYAVSPTHRGRPLSLADGTGLVLRCLGAYQHAAWLRARELRPRRLRIRMAAGVRDLRADPRPAALALMGVALTVGTAGVLFGVAGQTGRRVLPSADGERVVRLFNSAPAADLDRTGLSGFELARIRERSRTLEGVAAFRQLPPSASLRAARIAPEFLPLLRVTPSSGRGFVAGDFRPGAAPVAVVREDAGLAPGATLTIDGVRHAIVGVIPNQLRFPRPDTRVWLPLAVDSSLAALGERNTGVIGRLRPGVSPARAKEELTGLSLGLQAEHPEGYLAPFGVAWGIVVDPAGAAPREASDVAAMLLVGALLLGLAASGVAAGFVGRRTALAWVLPVGAGGCLGWALATLGLRLLHPADTGTRAAGVAAFALAVTLAALLSSLLIGLRRRQPAAARRSPLVTLCMVSSVVLLASAAAMTRAYRQVAGRAPGLDPAGLVALLPPADRRLDAAARARVGGLPGIEGVALTSHVPVLESAPAMTFEIEGAVARRGAAPSATLQVVDTNYFTVTRIPLLIGRSFAAPSPMEVVVNRTLATRFFGGEPLGRRLVVHLGPGRPSGWLTVIGVVGDVRRGAGDRTVAELYLPSGDTVSPGSAILARVGAAPPSTMAALGGLGRALPLDAALRAGIAPLRLATVLLILCASVMSWVTLVCCFAAARVTLARAALAGAAVGGAIVALGGPLLARLPTASPPSAVGLGLLAAGAALLLTLPAALARRGSSVSAISRASRAP